MTEQKIELKMIRMSEVQSQEIEWLWYPFIPYGKLTIIQGDPGDGKTTMVLNLAAKLSKGEALDENMKVTEPVNVIYQTAEDGLADTVKPRLELAGADCERIIVIDESDKSLSMVDERLEEAIVRTGARLLILDPIQAYLGGGMDMNRANEARDMTKKLGALAEKTKCAIILIGHMNKASGNKAAYRGMGSIDFFAVARSQVDQIDLGSATGRAGYDFDSALSQSQGTQDQLRGLDLLHRVSGQGYTDRVPDALA